jgi:hypothetical protein
MQFLSGIILQMSQADMGPPALARLQVSVTVHHAVPVRHHPADVPGGHGTSRPRPATGRCHCPSCSSCPASSCRCPRRTWDLLPSHGYRWVSLTVMQFLSGIILQMSQADMGAPALARLQVGVTDSHAVPVRHHPADVPGGPGTSRPRPATGGCRSPNQHYCRSGMRSSLLWKRSSLCG